MSAKYVSKEMLGWGGGGGGGGNFKNVCTMAFSFKRTRNKVMLSIHLE